MATNKNDLENLKLVASYIKKYIDSLDLSLPTRPTFDKDKQFVLGLRANESKDDYVLSWLAVEDSIIYSEFLDLDVNTFTTSDDEEFITLNETLSL